MANEVHTLNRSRPNNYREWGDTNEKKPLHGAVSCSESFFILFQRLGE